MSKTRIVPYTGTDGHPDVFYCQLDNRELYSGQQLMDHANKRIINLQKQVETLKDGILDARRTLDVKTYDALDWKIHNHLEQALKQAEEITKQLEE